MKAKDESEQAAPMTLQRRGLIADLVRQHGAVRVSEMAEQFRVSEVTIRNDLLQLEKDGLLVRDRGGAIAAATGREVFSLLAVEQRAHLRIEEKRRIARAAAQLVKPGDTIIMDAGTTVVEMARHLTGISPLTVVTNALNVALEVAAASPEAHIILLGGTFNRDSSSALGPSTDAGLREFIVQKAFLGTQAINVDDGLTDTTIEIAHVKRAMIRAARQIILLTDSSKWGKTGFIKVAPLSELDMIVSDSDLATEHRAAVENRGIELRLV